MKMDISLRKELWERYSWDNASLTPFVIEKLKEVYSSINEGEVFSIETPDGTFLRIENKEDFKQWLISEYDAMFADMILH